jgi:Leucine-rich repeat (LRR) protein
VAQLAGSLRALILHGNALSEIEPAVLALSQLEVLDVSCNRISGLPDAITASLPLLRVLNASSAGLKAVSDHILLRDWAHLQVLDLRWAILFAVCSVPSLLPLRSISVFSTCVWSDSFGQREPRNDVRVLVHDNDQIVELGW